MALLPDIPTIYLSTGLGSLIASAMLIWQRADHPASGSVLTLFAAAIFFLGLGFVSFTLRDVWRLGTVGPLAGYACFGISAVLIWLGSSHLHGTPTGRGPALIALAAFAAYLSALMTVRQVSAGDAFLRIVLSSGFLVVFLGLAARQAHRSPWMARLRAVRLMRALLLGFCALIAVRLLAFVLQGILLHADGTAPPGWLRMGFAIISGAMPFALAAIALCVLNGQLSARLHELATTDELTGLLTRRGLDDSLRRMVERRPASAYLALLMIDLDEFKAVNDRHGHRLGDHALSHVADLLREQLHEGSLLVRYGGDEFCVLVPVPGEASAFVLAERLRAAMEATPLRFGGQVISVTASIGVSVHRGAATLRQLLDEADRRAYRAKASGRNRVIGDDRRATPA